MEGYYFSASVQVMLQQGLGVSFIVGMDSFVFVVIWHTCGQLCVLQVQIRNLGNMKNVPKKTIKELIDKHNNQIRFNSTYL